MLPRIAWHFALLACLAWLMPSAAAGQAIKAKLDEFGNPVGEASLAGRNAFKGKRLLVWTIETEVLQHVYPKDNPLWQALQDKGFSLDLKTGAFDPKWLASADQLWIFGGRTAGLDDRAVQAVEKFASSGRGLYLVADNDPLVADVDTICRRLFDAGISGNYPGDQIIAVRGRGITRDDYRGTATASRTASSSKKKPPTDLPGRAARVEVIDKASHYVEDHAIMTGINFLYEGWTISHLDPSPKMQTVLTASDGQILAAVAKNRKLLVLADCGWTRYWTRWVTKTAGTLRYAENVAAYLMGKGRRSGGPEEIAVVMAAVDAGDASPADQAALAKWSKNPPKYAAVKDQLVEIWRLAASKNSQVADAARQQMANAFLRAPLSECLRWLATDDTKLRALIWEQLDDRIARADDERRATYQESALAVLSQRDAEPGSRRAAAELLGRLKNRDSIDRLLQLLPALPRDLWGPVGQALNAISGQNFGPAKGAGVAELNVALKKWRAWRQDQQKH